jgi:hypothetical protein
LGPPPPMGGGGAGNPQVPKLKRSLIGTSFQGKVDKPLWVFNQEQILNNTCDFNPTSTLWVLQASFLQTDSQYLGCNKQKPTH